MHARPGFDELLRRHRERWEAAPPSETRAATLSFLLELQAVVERARAHRPASQRQQPPVRATSLTPSRDLVDSVAPVCGRARAMRVEARRMRIEARLALHEATQMRARIALVAVESDILEP